MSDRRGDVEGAPGEEREFENGLDCSFVHRGPAHRALRALKLIKDDHHDVRRQAFVLMAITWTPVVVLELAQAWLYAQKLELLRNVSVHVRLLVAIPLLIAADAALERLCGRSLTSFVAGGFVRDAQDRTRRVVQRAVSWGDSRVVEGALVLLTFGTQLCTWLVTRKTGLLPEDAAIVELLPSRAWYAFFSVPLVNFLVLRLLYRWLIWASALYAFSRFDLRIVPTHPDNAGGLAYLAEPVMGFSLVLAAFSAVFSAVWAERIITQNLPLAALLDDVAVVLVLGEITALSPLVPFSGKLLHTRLVGLIEYGQLALRYTRAFHVRWVITRSQEGLLGSSDIQSLADLANSFEVIKRMRIVPFSVRHVVIVFVAIAAPMIPLLTAEVPLHEILTRVGRVMLGGLPP